MTNFFSKTLKAGFVAGTLDICAALIQVYIRTGKNPLVVLPFIASGVFGAKAFSGAGSMYFWGLVFHYTIAYSFTLIFFLIYPATPFFAKNKILTAVLYGIFMYSFMQVIVLPLANTQKQPFDVWRAIPAVLILIVCIGLPLTFMAGKYYKNKKQPAI